eukprot:m.229285 g.229285  ORF g.229285 m.229285 type:complete len:87 (-) comp17334_c0_seq34:202-462(-)
MSRLLKNCLHLFFPFRLDQHQNEYPKPTNDSPTMAIIMVSAYSLDLRPLVLFQPQQNCSIVAIHHLQRWHNIGSLSTSTSFTCSYT